jgi:hypothetical protein
MYIDCFLDRETLREVLQRSFSTMAKKSERAQPAIKDRPADLTKIEVRQLLRIWFDFIL